MKNLIRIIFIFFCLVSLFPLSQGTKGNQAFDIKLLSIKFDKNDAEFIVNYDLGAIPKMYIILMGAKSIEPGIREIFSNFDYEIKKMDQDKAILHVKNISRFEKGYYLHDSINFGGKINTMLIYIPGDLHPSEYIGMNATPNKFYRQ